MLLNIWYDTTQYAHAQGIARVQWTILCKRVYQAKQTNHHHSIYLCLFFCTMKQPIHIPHCTNIWNTQHHSLHSFENSKNNPMHSRPQSFVIWGKLSIIHLLEPNKMTKPHNASKYGTVITLCTQNKCNIEMKYASQTKTKTNTTSDSNVPFFTGLLEILKSKINKSSAHFTVKYPKLARLCCLSSEIFVRHFWIIKCFQMDLSIFLLSSLFRPLNLMTYNYMINASVRCFEVFILTLWLFSIHPSTSVSYRLSLLTKLFSFPVNSLGMCCVCLAQQSFRR